MDKMSVIDDILKLAGQLSKTDCELLWKTAEEIKPQTIVEIGSMNGTSSMLFASLLKKQGSGKLICIEPNVKQRWAENIKALGVEDYAVICAKPSPWVPLQFDANKQPIDYLFIDGEHRTRWCLVDYHFWEPFVRLGGRIAFHDYIGKRGEGKHVQRAIDMILETDDLREVGREERPPGVIVFEKPEVVNDMYGRRVPRNSFSQQFYEPVERKK